ncbi:MAG: HAD family hydrolase [Candidatus Methylomirabilales bacterium]
MGTRILDFRFGLVDLEGVVFNPAILYRREFGRFLQHRYRISAKEALLFYQTHEPLPLEVKFQRLLAQHGHRPEQAAEVAVAFLAAVAASRPVVSEGARELLETLVSGGVQLFALSERESHMAGGELEEAELRGLFRWVIGADQAPRGRGQLVICPEAVEQSLETFATQSFVLAGNPDDVAVAQDLGFYCVGVAHVFPETAFKAHGAQEVYRHIAYLSLSLRRG